jgi:signal peptidase I
MTKYRIFENGIERPDKDWEDKPLSCREGEKKEETFIRLYGEQLGLIINPEKKNNKYLPDLLDINKKIRADLKAINTPIFTVKSTHNIYPIDAAPFDVKDYKNYHINYPEIDVYFWLDWGDMTYISEDKFGNERKIEVKPVSKLFVISFEELYKYCSRMDEHTYEKRVGDKKGNAQDAFYVDTNNPIFKRLI